MDTYFDPDRPKNYSYKSINNSLADKHVLRRWWPIALKAVPARAPANLVSMLGNLGSYLAFLILSGLLFGPAEVIGREKPWIFGLVAFGLFFYQTLDALDGIQARRTGASGPLGEFVDHWFDSFNVFLVPLGFFLAFPVVPWQFLVPVLFVFTATNWIMMRSLLNTQTLVFEPLSSEEGQILAQLFYLSVWVFGYDFWAEPGFLGIPLIWVVFALFPLGMLVTAVRTYWESGGIRNLAIALSTLVPTGAWVYLAQPRIGRAALLVGGLLLGFSGSRYVGQVIQERIIGRTYRPVLADVAVGGLALCAIAAAPLIPVWAVAASGVLFLGWTAVALGRQFGVTLSRVRSQLGRGLFWPLTGSDQDRTETRP